MRIIHYISIILYKIQLFYKCIYFYTARTGSPELLMQLWLLMIPSGMFWVFHSFYKWAELCKNHGKTCGCGAFGTSLPIPRQMLCPQHTHAGQAQCQCRLPLLGLKWLQLQPCPSCWSTGSISPPGPWSQLLGINRISLGISPWGSVGFPEQHPPLAEHHLDDSNSSVAGFLLPSETPDNLCFYFYPGLVKGRCRTRSGVLGFPWPYASSHKCCWPLASSRKAWQDGSSLLPGLDPWGAARAAAAGHSSWLTPPLHCPSQPPSHGGGQRHPLQSKKHPGLWKNLGTARQQRCGWITTAPSWLGCSWDKKSQGEFGISREISTFLPVAVI